MARVSLFYTVAGSRTLFQCRALALLSTTIQTNGRNSLGRPAWRGLATASGTAAAAATASPAWRKGSNLHSVLITPDGVEQPQPQQHQHDEQLQPDDRAEEEEGDTAEDGAAAATAATERNESLKPARKFRPGSKRMLRIPEEEWPR